MSQETHQAEIAIVGGGLIGPALALVLKSAGVRCMVIDRQPVETRSAPDFDGRAYAIALASHRLLQTIGIWEQVASHAEPILDINVGDGTAPDRILHFDPRELDEGRFGWILEDRFLRTALLAALEREEIPHLGGAEVSRIERGPGSADLTLNDGVKIHARLAVAADGRRSVLAQAAGIRRLGWSYSQTGLVNAIEHAYPHRGVAFQAFFPGGPFAVLPLPGNRSSLVWSERRAEADRLSALPDADFTAELARRIAGRLGSITLAGPRWSYPLDFSLAYGFVAPRLALAGDAAHGVHPIAGQGFNLGLRDVAALAEVLVDARRRGEDIGSLPVLQRYQTWRRFDTAAMALGMDGLNRLFSNDIAPVKALRRAGMRAVSQLDTLRRGMMRQAIGTAGDLPRLLRGQPL
ncbi:MAG: UbiH/UbiF/VisC/COQ6 family ubiquinone biosynthesis hydroxylase [Pseudomonadota bacterium]